MRFLHGLRYHERHAQEEVIVGRSRKTGAKSRVVSIRRAAAYVRMPVGHSHDMFYARVAQSGGRAQAVAVERIEMRVKPLFAGSFDK